MNSDVSFNMDVRNTSFVTNYNLSQKFNENNFSDSRLDDVFDGEPRREVPSYHVSSQVTATVFFVVIFLIGVFGNLLVTMVVCLKRNLKTSLNIYLVNLCIADILVLTVCMPTVLVDVFARDVWYFGKTMCYLVPFLENTVVHASVLTLIAISIERYKVVCQPLRGIKDNFYKHIKIVPLIWLTSGISNVPWFYIAVYKDSRHFDGTQIKVCRLPMFSRWRMVYVTSLCVFFFVVPFFILLSLYSRICCILHNTKNIRSDDGVRDTYHCRQRRWMRAQVINIISSLVLVFFMFHVPYRAVSLWFTFADKYQIYNLGIHKYFNIVYSVRILFYFNHAINPIVYNFVSCKFRTALLSLITKRKCQGSREVSKNSRVKYRIALARPKNSRVKYRIALARPKNSRVKYRIAFARPKNNKVILMGKDNENNDILARGYSSTSSLSRQKMKNDNEK